MTQTLSANINGTLTQTINGIVTPIAYNDLYLNKEGNISVSYGLTALVEQCAQAAKTLLGECVLNTTIGIPYQQSVWVGTPNPQQFNAALRNAFLSINGVTEVISLIIIQSDSSDVNSLNYNAVINTIYGTGVFSG